MRATTKTVKKLNSSGPARNQPNLAIQWSFRAILALSVLTAGVLLIPSPSGADWSQNAISQSEIDPRTGDPFPQARFGAPPLAEQALPYEGLGAPGLNHEGTLDPVYGNQGLHAERAPASVPGLDPAASRSSPAKSQFHSAPTHTQQAYRSSSLTLTDLPKDRALASAIRSKGVQEVSIIAGDLGYFPKTVFVAPDIPVRLYITGASKKPLCLLLDSFNVRKQVRSQRIEEVFFTPSAPGKYRYYCPINGIEGSLIVKDTLPEESSDEAEVQSQAGSEGSEKQAWWSWPSWGSDEKNPALPQRKTRMSETSRVPAGEIQWSYAAQADELEQGQNTYQ